MNEEQVKELLNTELTIYHLQHNLPIFMDMFATFRKELENQNKRIDELMEYVARKQEDDKPKETYTTYQEELKEDMKEILFQVGYKKSYEKIIAEITRKGLESDFSEMLYVVHDKPNFCAYKFYFRKIYETYYPSKIQKVDL